MKAEIAYDHEGCFVRITDEQDTVLAHVYHQRGERSWDETRATALAEAQAKAETNQTAGPHPEPESLVLP